MRFNLLLSFISNQPNLQNQFGYRDGVPSLADGALAGAQSNLSQDASGGSGSGLEDQRCNGSLHKKKGGLSAGEDSGAQRYSADPTIFLGERATRGDTDEDGYMTPMKDKSSSGTLIIPVNRRIFERVSSFDLIEPFKFPNGNFYGISGQWWRQN